MAPPSLHTRAAGLELLPPPVYDQEDCNVAHQHHYQGQQPGQGEHKEEIAKLLWY